MGLDGSDEIACLAGGDGERGTPRVLGVVDGDVVLPCGVGERRDLEAASAGSVAVAALASRDAGRIWRGHPAPHSRRVTSCL